MNAESQSNMNKAVLVRKPLIAGNWKMHGSQSQVKTLIDGIKEGIKQGAGAYAEVDILVLPPLVYLSQARELLAHSAVMLGAQNLYVGTHGAYTGEVSGHMLADVGCQYVLIGHSERRSLFHEDLNVVTAKFRAAVAAGLQPILCVGETKEQREAGETEKVVSEQLSAVILSAGMAAFHQAVIAYEPVWAIGTGLTATPEQAQAVHSYIRHVISQNNVDLARTIRILYGGSMKADNAASLLAMPDIDGGLIGGASLDANSFLSICAAAHHEVAGCENALNLRR
jgi:triosephosphate isomerase (TIM)